MAKVKIQSVQAIKFVEFEMPKGTGGVRIFRGPNGAGKTTAIACVNALLGQKISLKPTDGAPKGVIEGLGVTKTVQSKITTKGSPEAVSLEGRFDFSDLVDPQIKDPAARNKSRVRALVGLTAKNASASDFVGLFDGAAEFAKVVKADSVRGVTDPLELADIVKSSAEAVAREKEAFVEDATSRWQLAIEQSKGAKPEQEPAPVKDLANRYAVAQQELQTAEEFIRANAKAVEHNLKVDQMIARHQEAKPTKQPEEIGEQLKKIRKTVADLELQLATAKKTAEALQQQFDSALAWGDRLAELEQSRLHVHEHVADVEPLRVAADTALKALETAEETKQRWEAAVRARDLADKIQQAKEEALRFRSIAASTGSVVTKMLPKSCPLQVNGSGLLGVHHAGRNQWVDLDQLSEGERWEVGLAVAIDAVGPGGVIPVRQEAWQSLDMPSRAAIAKQCEQAQVYIVTGEVAEGDLRVEEFGAA